VTAHVTLIVVDRGAIVCDVEPHSADAPLIVQAGEARVRVVGTRFTVGRVGESARVDVERGVVEVSSGGRSWRVGAGEAWPSAAATNVLPEPTASPPVAAPAPAGAATVSTVVQDKRATPHPRATPAPSVEEPTPRLASPSSQEMFESASRLEHSDPARAAALYGSVEAGADSWAQNALFAHGRLEASRGHQAEAKRLLAQYLSRFPRGPNADDARAVLQQLK
jgi:transmembrane sensor